MIRVQVEAKTVIEGYLTGSCIFWPNDAHDLDIINVCETINSYKEKIPFDKYTILSNPPRDLPLGLDLDVLNISPEELKERFNYRSTKFRWLNNPAYLIQNVFYDPKIIGSDFAHPFDFLSHRVEITQLLKRIKNNHLINFSSRVSKGGNLYKTLWQVALNLFGIMDNNILISKEHLNICKLIHDEKMPCSYIKEMATLIDSLDC